MKLGTVPKPQYVSRILTFLFWDASHTYGITKNVQWEGEEFHKRRVRSSYKTFLHWWVQAQEVMFCFYLIVSLIKSCASLKENIMTVIIKYSCRKESWSSSGTDSTGSLEGSIPLSAQVHSLQWGFPFLAIALMGGLNAWEGVLLSCALLPLNGIGGSGLQSRQFTKSDHQA